ncbi:hypothetical protein KIH74_30735 [Kineosporia sp. J2-2]|uniref:Calcium-binding protein n=1 Tax=Kineosporia corallincola TaxID=2835133 RepID=A0ABS5TRE2_9ACTN|nr:calcium-binding protein [Kineosporia corallincola]MBT0773362.1 hypothetical protein [Kineosporia corallincola]
MTVRLRRSVLPLAALVFLPAVPAWAAPVSSSTVVVRGQSLTYTAAAGQANRLTVTLAATDSQYEYVYTLDDVHPIAVEAGPCTHPVAKDLTRVVCTLEISDDTDPTFVGKFYLGDRDDTLRFVNPSGQGFYASQFWLGAGDDRAVTRQDDDGPDGTSVYGQDGDDTIETGQGGDLSFLFGGNGDDTIRVHGPGDAGPASGGNGDDRLYAYAGAVTFSGDAGDDLIEGGDGDDLLHGGKGNDRIRGRRGADRIYGNSGNDELHGGLGKDLLSGGPGRDVVVQR